MHIDLFTFFFTSFFTLFFYFIFLPHFLIFFFTLSYYFILLLYCFQELAITAEHTMSRDRAILLSLEKEASDIDKMKFKIKSYNLSLQGDQINFKVAFNKIFLSSSYVVSFFVKSILFHFIIIFSQYFSLSYVLFSFHFCFVILVNKSKQHT